MARFNVVTDASTGKTTIVPFTAQEEDAANAEAATPKYPPLSRRQVRKAMVYSGIGLTSVDAAIDAMPAGQARDLALIDWQDAPIYLRSHPLFDTLAPALNLTPAQIDSMWLFAATLDA